MECVKTKTISTTSNLMTWRTRLQVCLQKYKLIGEKIDFHFFFNLNYTKYESDLQCTYIEELKGKTSVAVGHFAQLYKNVSLSKIIFSPSFKVVFNLVGLLLRNVFGYTNHISRLTKV